MWGPSAGPAPAITPSVNKTAKGDTSNSGPASSAASTSSNSKDEESMQTKGGKNKKKKGRKLDTSLLGFTVQADPDRIKSGEIDFLDD